MLSIYLLFALALTLVQLSLEFANEKDRLEDDVSQILETFRPVFTTALWNLELEQAQSSVEGILHNRIIVAVELFDETGQSLISLPQEQAAQSFLDLQRYKYDYDFIHEEDDEKHPVGRITFYSNATVIVDRVGYTLAVTLGNALVKTFLLWLVCYISLARQLGRPLGKLTEAINAINPNSKSTVQVILDEEICSRPDELGNLARRCEAMRNALANSNNEIEKHQALLERRVEERTQQLEKASAAKSEFVAHMSHEIRTPMNGVIGLTQLLSDTPLNDNQRGYINTLQASGNALLGVIDNVLDYSKIEAGKLELEEVDFDLTNLIDDSVILFRHQCYEKKLNLVSIVSPEIDSSVRGDPTRLRQILINLVGNAIKFTDKGEVTLRITLEKDSTGSNASRGKSQDIRFEVADTGVGMTDAQQAKLFRSFTQTDSSTTRKYGGTGLGLVITKQLVQLMNSEIHVTSEAGKGSTFYFSIKLKAVEQPIHEIDHSQPITNTRMLIIDDNRAFLEFCMAQSQRWGIETETAICAEKAKSIIETRNDTFDIVLVDLILPDENGIDLAGWIHSFAGYADVPIVLISGQTLFSANDISNRANMGIVDALEKPISSSVLRKTISQYLPNVRITPAEASTDSEHFDHLKVLVAEDNKINQMVIKGLLNKLNISPDIAENGKDALAAYAQAEVPYDLIFMDCEMPIMDGWESTTQIRAHPRSEEIEQPVTIIALSAHAMNIERQRAADLGVDAYLSKPITLRDITRQLTELGLHQRR